jgi:hypothetical protein
MLTHFEALEGFFASIPQMQIPNLQRLRSSRDETMLSIFIDWLLSNCTSPEVPQIFDKY